MTACPLPAPPTVTDVPHKQAPDMQRDDIARMVGLDLAGCNVAVLVLALNEFDLQRLSHLGHRFDSWPADVQSKLEKELTDFAVRNGARIEAITQAIGGEPKCFILAAHWRPKS